MDEDQSEVQSTQWKAVCAKYLIHTRNSEPHCPNQNLVEHFVQTAAAAVSHIR